MSDVAGARADSRRGSPAVSVSVGTAALGAALYAALMARSVGFEPGAFGEAIYDQLWLAVLDGRLDLPARVLRLEGHYLPDGTGFSYHGVGPLLLRALLDPFVTIGQGSLAPISILVWTILGTGAWHAALLRVAVRAETGTGAAALLGAAVWLSGPGLLLAANHGFYHEPIAMAYAAAGGFALVWVRAAQAGRFDALALIALAILAAATVHARPNVAVGLYLATGVALAQQVWRTPRRALPAAVLTIALLGASGAGYLALNEARFGAATSVHGSFAPGDVQYGIAFWEMEEPGNPRQQGFTEHGRFNAGRILPNAGMYLAAPPEAVTAAANGIAREMHLAATVSRVGFVRVEPPGGGMLFLWTFWSVAAAFGLAGLRRGGRPYAGLLAGFAVSALVTLSYATITLRYHVDLWPLVAGLSLIGVAAFLRGGARGPRRAVLALSLALGCATSGMTAAFYVNLFRMTDGTGFAAWSEAECHERAEAKGIDPGQAEHVCRAPMIENGG